MNYISRLYSGKYIFTFIEVDNQIAHRVKNVCQFWKINNLLWSLKA